MRMISMEFMVRLEGLRGFWFRGLGFAKPSGAVRKTAEFGCLQPGTCPMSSSVLPNGQPKPA